jgi:hypothetical protein
MHKAGRRFLLSMPLPFSRWDHLRHSVQRANADEEIQVHLAEGVFYLIGGGR